MCVTCHICNLISSYKILYLIFMPRWSMAKYFSVNLHIQSFVVLKTIKRQTLRFLSSVKSRIQKGLTKQDSKQETLTNFCMLTNFT